MEELTWHISRCFLCSRSSSQCAETFTLPPLGIHDTRGAFPPGAMLLALGLGFVLIHGILALIVLCIATLPDGECGSTYPSELFPPLGDSLQSYTHLLDGPFQELRAEADPQAGLNLLYLSCICHCLSGDPLHGMVLVYPWRGVVRELFTSAGLSVVELCGGVASAPRESRIWPECYSPKTLPGSGSNAVALLNHIKTGSSSRLGLAGDPSPFRDIEISKYCFHGYKSHSLTFLMKKYEADTTAANQLGV